MSNNLFDFYISNIRAFKKTNIIYKTVNTNKSVHTTLILLIGDYRKLKSIKTKLEYNKITVIFMREPNEEVLLEQSLNIDCIITDYYSLVKTMEIINRITIFQMLYIPIIVINDITNSFKRKESYLHGVDDYISEYVDMHEVSIRLDRQIERKRRFNMAMYSDDITLAYNIKYLVPVYEKLAHLDQFFTLVLMKLHCDNDEPTVYTEVLPIFVQTVKYHLKKGEFIVRLNDNVLLLILPLNTVEKATRKVKEISDDFSTNGFLKGNQSFNYTFYTGVLGVSSSKVNLDQNIKQVNTLLNKAMDPNENRLCIMDSIDK